MEGQNYEGIIEGLHCELDKAKVELEEYKYTLKELQKKHEREIWEKDSYYRTQREENSMLKLKLSAMKDAMKKLVDAVL
jgi:ribosomal protein S4